jgi:hypothetical protein
MAQECLQLSCRFKLNIVVPKQRFNVWNAALRRAEILPGHYKLHVGGASRSPAMLTSDLQN